MDFWIKNPWQDPALKTFSSFPTLNRKRSLFWFVGWTQTEGADKGQVKRISDLVKGPDAKRNHKSEVESNVGVCKVCLIICSSPKRSDVRFGPELVACGEPCDKVPG